MMAPTSAQPVNIPVLYEDEVLIVIDKPAGLPTQATLDKKRLHVYGLLQQQLNLRNEEPTYLALHHRLDRDTSGVLLFCKDRKYNQTISRMFQQHEFEKVYWALTAPGKTKTSWQVKNHLSEKPRTRSERMKLQSVLSGGQLAITDFKILETHPKGLMIEARPRTGRMHQIRVHLSEAGLPILGDDLYNNLPRSFRVPRLMLHAYQLTFKHPQTQEPLTITSEPPADFMGIRNALG